MSDKMRLSVASAPEVRRDILMNLPWIGYLLLFAGVYALGSSALIRIFENEWSFFDACYFTIINMTTVGFGDFHPGTFEGKLIAVINALVGLGLFGAIVALVTLAFQLRVGPPIS